MELFDQRAEAADHRLRTGQANDFATILSGPADPALEGDDSCGDLLRQRLQLLAKRRQRIARGIA